MRRYTAAQARQHFSEVIDELERGESGAVTGGRSAWRRAELRCTSLATADAAILDHLPSELALEL